MVEGLEGAWVNCHCSLFAAPMKLNRYASTASSEPKSNPDGIENFGSGIRRRQLGLRWLLRPPPKNIFTGTPEWNRHPACMKWAARGLPGNCKEALDLGGGRPVPVSVCRSWVEHLGLKHMVGLKHMQGQPPTQLTILSFSHGQCRRNRKPHITRPGYRGESGHTVGFSPGSLEALRADAQHQKGQKLHLPR